MLVWQRHGNGKEGSYATCLRYATCPTDFLEVVELKIIETIVMLR
jgi:hypothetical protein